jgi:hypothetical protein
MHLIRTLRYKLVLLIPPKEKGGVVLFMSYLLFQYVTGMECTVTVEAHLDRRGIHRVTLHPHSHRG